MWSPFPWISWKALFSWKSPPISEFFLGSRAGKEAPFFSGNRSNDTQFVLLCAIRKMPSFSGSRAYFRVFNLRCIYVILIISVFRIKKPFLCNRSLSDYEEVKSVESTKNLPNWTCRNFTSRERKCYTRPQDVLAVIDSNSIISLIYQPEEETTGILLKKALYVYI